MRKYFTSIFIVILLGLLIVSCDGAQKINTPAATKYSPTHIEKSTPTKPTIPTTTPALTLTSTSIVTPFPTTFADATIEAFGPLCVGSKEIAESEISPDGKRIAAECYWENGTENSPLQVVSMDRSKDWKIYFRDYTNEKEYDRHDVVVPSHWSKDGRFLYASVGSRLDGCCWIGHGTVLLVRLSLETGEQVELLKATDFSIAFPFDFIISDSDRYLFFTSPTYQPYDFAVLDLQTWKTRTITLKFPYTINLNSAAISFDENKIVMPLYKYYSDDMEYKLDALVLINIKTNQQKLLLSGLSPEKEFYPVRWLDDNRVLLYDSDPWYWNHPTFKDTVEHWVIDINTNELSRDEMP